MSDPVPPTTAANPVPPRRRRRVLRVLLGLFVLLGLGVWFAPTVVAKTGLRNRLARTAAADLNGTLDIGSASLGWFSRVELRDVTLTDSRGRMVARVPKVTSTKSLFSLLRDRSDLGEFVLDRPAVEVVCEDAATNVEDVFRKVLADDGGSPAPTRPRVSARVTGGTLTLRDPATGRAGEFANLDVALTVPAPRSEPVAIALTADAPGRVEVEASLGESNRVALTAAGLALEPLAPLLRRAEPGLTLSGTATADRLTVTWGPGGAAVEGAVGAKDFALAAPWLEGDTLRLARLDLPLKASVVGHSVRVERADLTSDIGAVSVAGTFDSDEPLERLLDRPGMRLDATVDLARVSAVLPRLLRVREGTAIREGKLVVKVGSTATPGGTAWSGEVRTSALKAVRDGREVVWDDPLAVAFAGRFKPGELPTFEKLTCQSDFVAVNAEIKPDLVRASANLHLDRLASRVGDFVDLGGVTLDGRGTAWLVLRRTAEGAFKADAAVELKQFAFADRSGRGFREPALNLTLSAAGKAPDAGPVTVSAATVAFAAGPDELKLDLLEPIPDLKQPAAGKLDARLAGDLGRWRSRIGAFVRIPKHYVMGGTATANGTVRFAPGVVAVDGLSLTIEKARFRGAGIDLEQPRVVGVADLTVEPKTGTATFADFTITSAPLSVTRGRLVISAPANGGVAVEGGGPATSDLNRLGKTLRMYADPAGPNALHGKAAGHLRFRYAGGVTTFGGALDVTDFATGRKADPDWAEPRLRLEAEGSYSEAADAVTFTSAKVERPGLALSGAGTLGKFDTTADVNLNGTLAYDLAKLTPKLRDLLGGGFAGEGTGTKPFALAGSFAPPPKPGAKGPPGMFAGLRGEVGLGWASLRAYGFEVGRGELSAQLADGVAKVSPVAATFGGGKVNVHPTLRLAPEPGEVSFAPGLIVDRAKLTPAVCASALGYALPVVARAANAEGEVSVTLGENRIPFADVNRAAVRGRITIHKATVAAGPVVAEVAKLLGESQPTMTLATEQVVPVRVEHGRVHHQNLWVKLGAYTVVTTGSVGFDGTLDLVADVPIPGGLPGLKDAPRLAKALAGKRVQVPVKGTLAAPALDPRLFQAAVAKLAREAAADVGKELLDKELGKLFPGGMPGPGSPRPGGFFPFPRE